MRLWPLGLIGPSEAGCRSSASCLPSWQCRPWHTMGLFSRSRELWHRRESISARCETCQNHAVYLVLYYGANCGGFPRSKRRLSRVHVHRSGTKVVFLGRSSWICQNRGRSGALGRGGRRVLVQSVKTWEAHLKASHRSRDQQHVGSSIGRLKYPRLAVESRLEVEECERVKERRDWV
jgi:hypothetical protein